MTKYILHGGATRIENERNKAFYQEWVKTFDDDFMPTILLVYFSQPKEKWEDFKSTDEERFYRYNGERNVSFVLASDDVEMFKSQVKDADVVYVRGGSSDLIIQMFEPFQRDFISMLDGKIYAGSSAGVMVLSHNTKSDTSVWKKGHGLLPFNSVVHWSEDMRDLLEEFKKNNPDNSYEYLLLPETEFIIKEF